MTALRRLAWASLIAVTAIVAAGEASAQFGGGFPGGSGRGSRGGRGDGGRDVQQQRPAERQGGPDAYYVTMEELRIDLKLTAEQQPSWDGFVRKLDAMRADLARERARAGRGAAADAPQQIDQAVDSARNRLTALEDIAAAAKGLYATLNEEQRKVADPRLARLVQAP